MSVLDAALRHALSQRPVFPCGPNKAPLTPNGLKDATTDGDTIEAWFDRDNPPMIGLPTGAASRLVVLDVDADKEGWESLRDLEKRHGALPLTASVKTPSGGEHFYFKHPGERVPNSVDKLAPGIDVRGDGGYVIVPPSRLPDGRGYVVDEECRAAEMPAWMRTNGNGNGKRTPSSEWLELLRAGATQGSRNDRLARLVGHLLRRYVHVDVVAELAHMVNATRFRPPLDAEEVDRIVESISAAELRRRGKS